MQHKLINTGDYLLIVDEDVTKAKEGCWMYRDDVKQVYCDKNFWFDFKEPYKKIIAHLPLNNSPILEGVDLLPPIEDDVEKLAEDMYREFPTNPKDKPDWKYNRDENCFRKRKAFVKGYTKAKEKYKYTEEDMRIAIQQAFLSGVERLEDFGKVESMIIGNIQQPKMPVSFLEKGAYNGTWVGEYIY